MKCLYIIMILLLIPLTCAIQPTQQYSKLLLMPYYVNAMSQNVLYNYSVDIRSPDGIGNIKSAIVTFDAWINPTRVFNAWMNGVQCNTKNYTISTTYASAGRGVIAFDCTNAVIPNKINTVSFAVSGGNIGSSTAWIELSYENNPKGNIMIHGTEYSFGQTSKAWLQLLNSTGSPVSNGVCYTDIYNPDMTQFLERAVMSNPLHDGLYYYDVTLPFVEGVYPVIALCYYLSGQYNNFATNITMVNGTLDSGTINDTRNNDGVYLATTESSASLGNPRRYDSRIYFDGRPICSNISELLLNGISVGWTGRWNSNINGDNITISLWNYSSSSWFALPNRISGSDSGVKTVSNSLSFNNISVTGFVNSSGTNLILRFQDTGLADTTSTGMDYDYVYVSCDSLASPIWQSVMGSSEFHLSQGFNYSINLSQNISVDINTSEIAFYVWNYSIRNLTYYPPQTDLTNYSLITENVWSYVARYIHGVII